MYILYLYSLRNVQIHMRKVPDGADPVRHQLVSHFHSAGLGNRQHGNIYVILPDKRFQLLHGHNLHTTDILPHKLRIRIEHSFEDKSSAFKVQIITQSSAQVTGSDNNEIVLFIQS